MGAEGITFTLFEMVAVFVFILSVVITPMALWIWHRITGDVKKNQENIGLLFRKQEWQDKHVPTYEKSSEMTKRRIRRAFSIHDTKQHKDAGPTFPKPEDDL